MIDHFQMAQALKAAEQKIETLSYALEQSLKLQSHYAHILNIYDGGMRTEFKSVSEWLKRIEDGNKMEHQGETSKMPKLQEGGSDR